LGRYLNLLSALAVEDKKAQLSLTNPRDAKICRKLLQFDVLSTLSLTILAYLHSFSCCSVRNLRNPAKFIKIQTYGVQGHPTRRIPTYVITIHQRHRQTDGRTDGQTTCDRKTALCTVVHRAVKKNYATYFLGNHFLYVTDRRQ